MQELKTSLLPVLSRVPGWPGARQMLLASSKETRALCNQQPQVFSWYSARLSLLCTLLLHSNIFFRLEGERALMDAH